MVGFDTHFLRRLFRRTPQWDLLVTNPNFGIVLCAIIGGLEVLALALPSCRWQRQCCCQCPSHRVVNGGASAPGRCSPMLVAQEDAGGTAALPEPEGKHEPADDFIVAV